MMKKFGNVMIFGDSYSTFEGWIPEGYYTYYSSDMGDGPKVERVEDTWWHILLTRTKSKLVRNDSWSGSAVCYRTYGNTFNIKSSFIGRLRRLKEDGFFEVNKIDTFFVFGGTNDVCAKAELGVPKYEGIVEGDNEKMLPAFCTLISEIKKISPESEICVITNCDLNSDFEAGLKTVCEHYGIVDVVLHDVSKVCGHPDSDGMRTIANQIEAAYTGK